MKFLTFLASFFIALFSLFATVQSVEAQTTRLGGMNLWGYCQSINQGGSELRGDTWTCQTGQVISLNNACAWQYARPAEAIQEQAGNPFTWACYAVTATPTPTPTIVFPTATPVPTSTPVPTIAATATPIPTNTPIPTIVPTATPVPTIAPTATPVPTAVPTQAPTPTPTVAPGQPLGGMNLWGYCQSLGQGGSELRNQTWTCQTGQVIQLSDACVWQYNRPAVAQQTRAGDPFSWSCFSANPTPTPTPIIVPTSTPVPTVAPTNTPVPTVAPTATIAPTQAPTTVPTNTPAPTAVPTIAPTSTPVPTVVPTATTAPTPTPTVAPGQPLGGMNLWGYCQSLGQGGSELRNQTWTCQTGQVIQLSDACVWQYNRPAVAQQTRAGDPFSWSCFSANPTPTPTPIIVPTSTPVPTVAPTNTPVPTVVPTATTAPTPTTRPTATPVPTVAPTATPVPTVAPTATPVPTVAPTATPVPTAVPTPTTVPTQAPTPTPTNTPGGQNTLVIFDEVLNAGWTDVTYRGTSAIETNTNTFSGTRVYAVTLNANGGFALQSAGFTPNQNTIIRFSVRGTQANQRYEVYVDRTPRGAPITEPVSLADYGGVPPVGTWRTYEIPMRDVNPGFETIRDIVIHDDIETNQPMFYVDRIELANVTVTPAPSPTQVPTPTQTPVPTVAPTATPTPTQPAIRVRKSIYDLTPDELQRLTNAFNVIRANGTYQQFVDSHAMTMMTQTLYPGESGTQRNAAHRGPVFGPWHREAVWELEAALRAVDPTVSLPYWPFEQDAGQGTPRIFSAAYFGSDGNRAQNDRVTDGPFASWNIVRRIARDPDGATTLPTQAQVNALMSIPNYDTGSYSEFSQNSFRNALEGWVGPNTDRNMHNRVHSYIGGDMSGSNGMNRIVNDPVFWMLHANVDRIYWQWQQIHGENVYVPAGTAPPSHGLNDTMQFLNRSMTPAQVLDTDNMGYTYE